MEIWKPIRGYEGYYEISDGGRVRSVDRYVERSDGVIQLRRGKMHRVFIDKDGYIHTKLCRDGSSKIFAVHRLVYLVFVGDIPDGYDIDHIDNNRQNNNVSNLVAMPHAENVEKCIRLGRHVCTRGIYRGEGNPNYGNKTLSRRYSENPELAKAKQSRCGSANGRARAVKYSKLSGDSKVFDYIRQCAEYIITHHNINQCVETVAQKVKRAAETGDVYIDGTFEFV